MKFCQLLAIFDLMYSKQKIFLYSFITSKHKLYNKDNRESSVLERENPRAFINYLGINRGKPFLSTLLSISICDQFLSVR